MAFALGLLAAFGSSCAGTGVKGGIPQASADDLKSQISDVQEFVDRGECDGIDGQLRQVQQAIDNLPASTDEALVANLRQGAEQLQSTAISACNSRTRDADADPDAGDRHGDDPDGHRDGAGHAAGDDHHATGDHADRPARDDADGATGCDGPRRHERRRWGDSVTGEDFVSACGRVAERPDTRRREAPT